MVSLIKFKKVQLGLWGEGVERLSQYVTDRMIEAAVKNLSPEKAESVRSWYEKVRPSIEGAWSQRNRAISNMVCGIIR